MNFWAKLKLTACIFLPAVFARFRATEYSPFRSRRPTSPQDARFNVTAASRTTIAEKAKDFEDNNAVAQRIGEVFVNYTVGPQGLVLIPNSTDKEWNAAAKIYWQNTCNFIDLKSRQNFGCLQSLIAWRWLFDGEIFIYKTRGQANDGSYYPRIQLIEYHLVGTPPDRAKDEGKTIVDGVEIDANGRPTAYWVKDSSTSLNYRPIPAADIIHVFEPTRPGQYRGISFFHAAINYLEWLDDLQDLEFRAITDAAEKSTFVKTVTGQMPPGMNGGGLPGDSFGLDQPMAGLSAAQRGEDLQEAVGGRTVALNLGEDVSQFAPVRPTESTRALWSYLTSCVCSSVGIPKMICFSEWLDKAQGTVVRGDYDIAAQFFRSRSAVIAAACREVYIYVIGWGIRTDASIADKPGDGSWVNVTVRPPRAPNVDVGRNASADIAGLAARTTNYDLIYAPQGLDWQEELTKLADQVKFINDLAAERGLQPAEIREQAAIVMQKAKDALAAETVRQQQEETQTP